MSVGLIFFLFDCINTNTCIVFWSWHKKAQRLLLFFLHSIENARRVNPTFMCWGRLLLIGTRNSTAVRQLPLFSLVRYLRSLVSFTYSRSLQECSRHCAKDFRKWPSQHWITRMHWADEKSFVSFIASRSTQGSRQILQIGVQQIAFHLNMSVTPSTVVDVPLRPTSVKSAEACRNTTCSQRDTDVSVWIWCDFCSAGFTGIAPVLVKTSPLCCCPVRVCFRLRWSLRQEIQETDILQNKNSCSCTHAYECWTGISCT